MSPYKHYNKHSFKAVALDLDGTLLDNNKKVSKNSRHMLHHLSTHYNVEILLISGRAPNLIEPIVDSLGVNCYIVGYNGAQGLTKKDENGKRQVFFIDPLPTSSLDKIFHFVTERNLPINVYLDCVYGLDKADLKQYNHRYSKLTGATFQFVQSLDELKGTQPPKSLIITEDEALCDKLMVDAANAFPELAVIKSNCHSHEHSQYYVELLQKGVDKGTALHKFCSFLGNITTDEIIAFGDAENDENMIRVAKLGICMAHGKQSVKDIANCVAEFNNDQDGVARELEKIFDLKLLEPLPQ